MQAPSPSDSLRFQAKHLQKPKEESLSWGLTNQRQREKWVLEKTQGDLGGAPVASATETLFWFYFLKPLLPRVLFFLSMYILGHFEASPFAVSRYGQAQKMLILSLSFYKILWGLLMATCYCHFHRDFPLLQKVKAFLRKHSLHRHFGLDFAWIWQTQL